MNIGKNQVVFYINKDNLNFARLEEVVQKLNTTYEELEISFKFIVERPNGQSISYSMYMELENLDDDVPVDIFVEIINIFVDNLNGD